MKWLPAMTAAGALALAAGTASAAEMTGQIDSINHTAAEIMIGDTVFTVSPTNTVGPDLTELQEGDEVRVFYSPEGGPEARFHAMTITRIGEAGADTTEEVSGTVEQVDTDNRTFVVDGTTYVIPEGGPVQIDQLSEGEEVMVVYDTADAEEPIEVINLWPQTQ